MQSFANEPGLHLLAMLQYIEQSWVAVDQAHRTVMSLNDSPTAKSCFGRMAWRARNAGKVVQ